MCGPRRDPIETKPGEADKTLYVVASSTLSALRTSDGSHLWRYQQNNGFLLWQGPDDQRGAFLTLIEVNGVIFLSVDGYKSVFPYDGTGKIAQEDTRSEPELAFIGVRDSFNGKEVNLHESPLQ
jgi:hypothetical protein